MLIKCRIEYVDDKSQMETCIKTNHQYKNDEEDEKIFFYGLSLEEVIDIVVNKKIVENEWKILEILDIEEGN